MVLDPELVCKNFNWYKKYIEPLFHKNLNSLKKKVSEVQSGQFQNTNPFDPYSTAIPSRISDLIYKKYMLN